MASVLRAHLLLVAGMAIVAAAAGSAPAAAPSLPAAMMGPPIIGTPLLVLPRRLLAQELVPPQAAAPGSVAPPATAAAATTTTTTTTTRSGPLPGVPGAAPAAPADDPAAAAGADGAVVISNAPGGTSLVAALRSGATRLVIDDPTYVLSDDEFTTNNVKGPLDHQQQQQQPQQQQAMLVARNVTLEGRGFERTVFDEAYVRGRLRLAPGVVWTFKHVTVANDQRTSGPGNYLFVAGGPDSGSAVVMDRSELLREACPSTASTAPQVAETPRARMFPGGDNSQALEAGRTVTIQGRTYAGGFIVRDYAADVPVPQVEGLAPVGGFAARFVESGRSCIAYVDDACLRRRSPEACIADLAEAVHARGGSGGGGFGGHSHGAAAAAAAAAAAPGAAVVAGAVVAAVLGAALLALAALLLVARRRRLRRHEEARQWEARKLHSGGGGDGGSGGDAGSSDDTLSGSAVAQDSVAVSVAAATAAGGAGAAAAAAAVEQLDDSASAMSLRQRLAPGQAVAARGPLGLQRSGGGGAAWVVASTCTTPTLAAHELGGGDDDAIEFGELLGSGSYGRVYRAVWAGREVAVKVIQHSLHNRANVESEVMLALTINHANVVRGLHYAVVLPGPSSGGGSGGSGGNGGNGGGDAPPSTLASATNAITRSAGSLSSSATTTMTAASMSASASTGGGGQPLPPRSSAGGGGGGDATVAALAARPRNANAAETWLVQEYCDVGTLHAVAEGLLADGPWAESRERYRRLLLLLRDAARGVLALHRRSCCHGDLNARNVLVASDAASPVGMTAKVADLGLSRCLRSTDATHRTTNTIGTLSHMPPEVMRHGRMSPAADVYAFGVMLYEVFTGRLAFRKLSYGQFFETVVLHNLRPLLPPETPASLRVLAESCWIADAQLRPPMERVEACLGLMLEELDEQQQQQQQQQQQRQLQQDSDDDADVNAGHSNHDGDGDDGDDERPANLADVIAAAASLAQRRRPSLSITSDGGGCPVGGGGSLSGPLPSCRAGGVRGGGGGRRSSLDSAAPFSSGSSSSARLQMLSHARSVDGAACAPGDSTVPVDSLDGIWYI